MVSEQFMLPEVIELLYSKSPAKLNQPATISPRFGIACSDLRFMLSHYDQGLLLIPLELHKKCIGGLIQSEDPIVNSSYTAKHERYLGVFNSERDCLLSFRGVARASLGSTKFPRYTGSAFRLMTEDEHAAYLKGYAKGIMWYDGTDDLRMSRPTIDLLYQHTPFREDIGMLVNELLVFGAQKNYDSQVEEILSAARAFKEKVS